MNPVHVIVDRYHVSTPVEDVLRHLRMRVERARARGVQISRREEKALYRHARARHRANLKLYVTVMKGI